MQRVLKWLGAVVFLLEEIAGDDLWRRYLPGEPHPSAWVTRIGTAIV
jgi:hypothetical protein